MSIAMSKLIRLTDSERRALLHAVRFTLSDGLRDEVRTAVLHELHKRLGEL